MSVRIIKERESVAFLLHEPSHFLKSAKRYAVSIIFTATYGVRLASLKHSIVIESIRSGINYCNIKRPFFNPVCCLPTVTSSCLTWNSSSPRHLPFHSQIASLDATMAWTGEKPIGSRVESPQRCHQRCQEPGSYDVRSRLPW